MPGEGTRARRTALVVDDLEDMLDLLEIALNAADFVVLRASCAEDALELFEARSEEIDLLMTDIRVGTDSGLELAQSLLSSKPSLQVLAISGFALDGRVVSGPSSIDFLAKPFSTSDLNRKLQALFPSQPPALTVTVLGTAERQFKVTARCTRTESGPGTVSLPGGRRL